MTSAPSPLHSFRFSSHQPKNPRTPPPPTAAPGGCDEITIDDERSHLVGPTRLPSHLFTHDCPPTSCKRMCLRRGRTWSPTRDPTAPAGVRDIRHAVRRPRGSYQGGTITATRRRAARVRTGVRGRHGDCNGLSGASPDGWGAKGCHAILRRFFLMRNLKGYAF